ncbi:branched-chain amino acid transaminase [Patescibacteria group bacterium]
MTERVKLMMPNAYFRGEIVPSEKAKISIASHSLQYGTTCFGGLRGYYNDGDVTLFRMEDHYERLMNAVKIFGIDYQMSFGEFQEIIFELIKSNNPESDFYMRPFIYSDDEELTPKFEINFDFALYMISLGDYLDTSKGLRVLISSWKKFSDASISTKAKAGGTYLNSALARSDANRLGYDEALVMDHNWNIVEGSAENLLVVYRGEVITPPTGSSMLEGVTMRTVIDFLKDAKIPLRFEKIDRSMIYTCDELLLTGTAAQVLYAESVDDRMIGKENKGEMGPVCKLLRKNFDKLLSGKHPRSKEWLSHLNLR